MKNSEVLSYLRLEFVLRGDSDYTPETNINDLSLEIINGVKPTNEAFHIAAAACQLSLDLKTYGNAVADKLNATAQEKSYDNAISCATYATANNPQWKAEAQAFIDWRDACWQYAYTILDEVERGIIPAPTLEEFMAGLPQITWPQ